MSLRPSTSSTVNRSPSRSRHTIHPPPPLPSVITSPPWAKDEPPSPTEEQNFADSLHAVESHASVPSFNSAYSPSNSASRWWAFARPRGDSDAAEDPYSIPPLTEKPDRRTVSFTNRSISWRPSGTRDGSTFPRRNRQLNRNWNLSITLPTPPAGAFTAQHNATPGWDAPWTSRVGAQGPAGRHHSDSSSYNEHDEESGSPGGANKDHTAWQRRRRRLRTFILTNTYVPLLFRCINLAFTTTALGIAIRIRLLERRLNTMGELGSSPTLVIIFAPPTLVHVLTSIYFDYFGRPLGLWRTSAKLAHTLFEVFFICMWSAALSLCFDNFFTSVIPCASGSTISWYSTIPRPQSNNDPVSEDQRCDDQGTNTLEMDTFSSPGHPARSISRSGKSVSPSRAQSRLRATRDYAIGIGLLLVVVILWTSSNFVTQSMYQGGFEKPFLVTYMNTSAFALYLIPFKLRQWWRKRNGTLDEREPVRRGRMHYQPLAVDSSDVLPEPEPIHSEPFEDELPPLTVQETARLAFVFCFLWFIANWAVNASLDYTSVASATILSSMSGFFTLGIGRIFRVERLTVAKVGAVVTSFGGVILVSVSDSIQPQQPAGPASRPLAHAEDLAPHPILGDSLALISALFYALYVILLKVRIRSESRVDMQLFFGFVGLFNILMCWPIGLFLHLIGVETLELPHGSAVAALAVNMAITLSSDYLYVLAMLKTTPLVVTVGLSLTIPLAVLGDFILGKFTRGQVIFGALLVLLSFVVVGLDNEKIKTRPEEIVHDDTSSVDGEARQSGELDRRPAE
ncbi:hypothetical protein R3P38DRAFT_3249713 [Favolaschia claudopus]|uniref:EamA domain-containing protein n=1 Tax=Favolaschia claudopus TaxID=2862362 RepID=A0AAW0EHZ0_9AGAR